MSARDTLVALGASLLAAGLLARLGRRIGLPTIPLFMIAGLLFGPNTPGIQLVDDPGDFALLATLGLILLLFYLGLEFSIGELTAGGRSLASAGAIYLGLNIAAGLAFGFAIGWGTREALVLAGAVGISSSAIVTKILVEMRRLTNRETRLILGIVVVEDLFLAVYLAALQPVLDESATAGDAALSFLKALAFLVMVAVIARYGASLVGRAIGAEQDELLTVCFVGLAVLVAGIAEEVNVSDAIGAFMAGLVIAETTVAPRVRKLVLPLRDTFAALFFFTFGLTVDPGDVASVAAPIAIAIVMTVVVNLVAAVVVSRRSGLGRVPAANLATTILARGEFSLIIAALGAEAGLDPRVVPFVAGYVLILALAAPVLAARSTWIARGLPRRLVPEPG
ncbi:MAG TPA: cation:proton antiporter [Acidimicrobiia bacterium]|nr:cation:proton antiporter [Acidimicrobiia bacterium]